MTPEGIKAWPCCTPGRGGRPTFADDVQGTCAKCKAPIVYRPSQVPAGLKCVCLRCSAASSVRSEEMEF